LINNRSQIRKSLLIIINVVTKTPTTPCCNEPNSTSFSFFTFYQGTNQIEMIQSSFKKQLIWLACVWVVWTERNHRLFRGSASTPTQMLDKIKLHSFRWLKATSVTLASNCHSWWSNPLLCLGFVWNVLVIFMWLFVNSGSLLWHILC
jgi:hypothetical protein